ncbi:MAG: hypothetical protein AAGC95_14650 [Pseudomonadota bacterium]
MRRPQAKILFSVCGLIGFVCGFIPVEKASAAAWTQATDRGLSIFTFRYADAHRRYDENGAAARPADFQKYEIEYYGEFGVTDRTTLVLRSAYQRLIDDGADPPMKAYGGDGIEFALRQRLYQRAGFIVSAQPGLTSRSKVQSTGAAPLSGGGVSYEMRLLGAYGAKIADRKVFLNAEGAYRWRTSRPPNEWRADVTLGFEAAKKLEVFAQSFSTISDGDGRAPFEAFRAHKAQLSLAYRITPKIRLQVGGFHTYAGKNVLRESGALISVWIDRDYSRKSRR